MHYMSFWRVNISALGYTKYHNIEIIVCSSSLESGKCKSELYEKIAKGLEKEFV
jgi:hypothetical protein